MSLIKNVDHLFATRGISAVVVHQGDQRVRRGEDRWTSILSAAIELRDICDQDSIRITLAEHSVVIQREKDQTAAVLMRSGDPVAKSLKRMIRRMAARVRPPIEPVSQQATPSSTSESQSPAGFQSPGSNRSASFML